MKPSAPERHSTRYVWKSLQWVAPSAVFTLSASVCKPILPMYSVYSSPQNS